jgi:hypothetical protein
MSEETETTRYCEDCVWFVWANPFMGPPEDKCTRPSVDESQKLVRRQPVSIYDGAADQRRTHCGAEGKYWVKRPVKPPEAPQSQFVIVELPAPWWKFLAKGKK